MGGGGGGVLKIGYCIGQKQRITPQGLIKNEKFIRNSRVHIEKYLEKFFKIFKKISKP